MAAGAGPGAGAGPIACPVETDKSQSTFGTACSKPDIGTSNLTGSNVATISMTAAPATEPSADIYSALARQSVCWQTGASDQLINALINAIKLVTTVVTYSVQVQASQFWLIRANR